MSAPQTAPDAAPSVRWSLSTVEQPLRVLGHGTRLILDLAEGGQAFRDNSGDAVYWVAEQMFDAHAELKTAFLSMLAELRAVEQRHAAEIAKLRARKAAPGGSEAAESGQASERIMVIAARQVVEAAGLA